MVPTLLCSLDLLPASSYLHELLGRTLVVLLVVEVVKLSLGPPSEQDKLG